MIGIIAAMEEELQEVLKFMSNVEEESKFGVKFYRGLLEQKQVVLMLSGIAKINASFSTSLLILTYGVSSIINVGSAGGLKDNQKLLDVVVSTHVGQHDLDVGRAKGELGGQPRFFQANQSMIDKIKQIDNDDILIHYGLIVSGDQFIMSKATAQIVSDFEDALCVEMEACAVAQVCVKTNVPFVIIRSISDLPYEVDNGLTFEEYLPKAAHNSALITKYLVASM